LHRTVRESGCTAGEGPKPACSEHVDLSAKQRFQVDLELRVVEQAPAELEVHEDVDVTVRTRLSAGHGSEHADVAGAMALSDGQDLVTGLQKRVNIHWLSEP
jgi:hypothetical protein